MTMMTKQLVAMMPTVASEPPNQGVGLAGKPLSSSPLLACP